MYYCLKINMLCAAGCMLLRRYAIGGRAARVCLLMALHRNNTDVLRQNAEMLAGKILGHASDMGY